MVDPVEFGEMRGNVRNLIANMDTLMKLNAVQTETLQAIKEKMAETRGSWKTLAAFGAAAGTLGASIGSLIELAKDHIK